MTGSAKTAPNLANVPTASGAAASAPRPKPKLMILNADSEKTPTTGTTKAASLRGLGSKMCGSASSAAATWAQMAMRGNDPAGSGAAPRRMTHVAHSAATAGTRSSRVARSSAYLSI
jgi:hypothetical protein